MYTLFAGLTYDTCGYFASCVVFFRAPQGSRKNTSNVQNVREYYMLNHQIRDLLFHYKNVLFASIYLVRVFLKQMHHLSFRALANNVNSTESHTAKMSFI